MSYLSAVLDRRGPVLPLPFAEGVDGFITRTYAYLFAALAGMSLFGMASYHYLPAGRWLAALSIADGTLWILCGWLGWRRPIGLVFPLFILVTGLVMGQLALFYPAVFLSACTLALLAFGVLSVVVFVTGYDFSFLRGFLCLSSVVILCAVALSFYYHEHSALFGWTGFCLVVFGCWILYDTSQIIERADDDLTPAAAAFELILDLVVIQSWILDYLDERNSRDDKPGAL